MFVPTPALSSAAITTATYTKQPLQQVAFSVTIPAMLLASTTKTLTAAQPANLLAIPAIAVAQIALGALFGRWAAAAVQGKLVVTRLLFGWQQLHPTASAAAIAASTAAALRAPMVGHLVGCCLGVGVCLCCQFLLVQANPAAALLLADSQLHAVTIGSSCTEAARF